jgi:hypothetical protein
VQISIVTGNGFFDSQIELKNGFSKTNMDKEVYLFCSWGAGNDPAERTVLSVDPLDLNQVILAEGKHK